MSTSIWMLDFDADFDFDFVLECLSGLFPVTAREI